MHENFVGRKDEKAAFERWVEVESHSAEGERAALLVGVGGMGKSALLRHFESVCTQHSSPRWNVLRSIPHGNLTSAEFIPKLLQEMHRLLAKKPISQGPRDSELKSAVLESVPVVGKSLNALTGDDKRADWERFNDYVHAVSDVLQNQNERLVLLIDPEKSLHSTQVNEWLPIARHLPPCVRVLIAQRPDDVIAAHAESGRVFARPIEDNGLGQLSESEVEEYYEKEFTIHRFATTEMRLNTDARRRLGRAAYERYEGYPLAHDAIVLLLTGRPVEDPVGEINTWPKKVEALMDMLFKRIDDVGRDSLRAALVLEIFGLPTPLDIWAKASGMAAEALAQALRDPRFGQLFDSVSTSNGRTYAPFHALFAERIGRELRAMPERAEELAQTAWQCIEPKLAEETLATSAAGEFDLIAATNIASWMRDPDHLIRALNRVFSVKMRMGMLDAAVADCERIMSLYASDHANHASALGNLGIVYGTRGDLEQAEAEFRKALAINEKLGRLEGMANQYGNLGIVYQTRGDLEQAEAMYRKALAIEEKLGRLEGMASLYGNLGIVYRTRGDLEQAEAMYRKSLAIEEKLGRLEGMASDYGNLGILFKSKGDIQQARECWTKSVSLYQRIGMPSMVVKVESWLSGLPNASSAS